MACIDEINFDSSTPTTRQQLQENSIDLHQQQQIHIYFAYLTNFMNFPQRRMLL